MQVVIQILSQLGANQTAVIQFVIFIVAISFLTIFVYGPFFKAFDQRLQQTKGVDDVAAETQNEAKKIEAIYQTRAREINEKIKKIFDSARAEASSTAETVLEKAKVSTAEQMGVARKEISNQKNNAEKEVARISGDIATELTKKLTGANS